MENNIETTTNTPDTQTHEMNYKQEYERQLLEIEKLRSAISKVNSENAEYKRKADAQMSEEEKKAKELQDLVTQNEEMNARIAQMQLEKDLLANGFTAEEIKKLIDGKFTPKDIAEIIKKRVDEAVKSTKAEFTKTSTPQSLMGNSVLTLNEHPFAQMATQYNQPTNREQEIKDFYKK